MFSPTQQRDLIDRISVLLAEEWSIDEDAAEEMSAEIVENAVVPFLSSEFEFDEEVDEEEAETGTFEDEDLDYIEVEEEASEDSELND